ncbi:hypothetical protein [Spirosoma fluviale]|uniref:Uncharacterized protein n=1 Tax=Spirosoma fluviale TaxID=1597977 RepID=A0A286GQN7_9BACT|nr:hypothetical protein [Spirosoma fluviale]SOD97812.1 hypothetical protein SAMN06269250_5929 [Spirosoma fluviale]
MSLPYTYSAELGYQAPDIEPIPTPPFIPVPMFGTGLLSRAIQNLQGSIQELLKLTGLPVEAHNKRSSMLPVLANELLKITAIQPVVSQFVVDAMPGLQQAQANLEANTNLDQVVAAISRVGTLAGALKQGVDDLSSDINATHTQIIDLITSLAPLKKQIQNQQIHLQGELEAEENKLKNPWIVPSYWLVEEIRNQIRFMEAYSVSLKESERSLTSMVADFSGVINQISYVSNAVHIVASEDAHVIDDLKNTQGDQLIARIYLMTTISQLQTLETDAS